MNQSFEVLLSCPSVADDALKKLASDYKAIHLNQLFKKEDARFKQYSVQFDKIVYDFSKQRVNAEVLAKLIEFAEQKQLPKWIETLFSEQKINASEQRAAMHWALRLPKREQHSSVELVSEQVSQSIVDQVHVQLDRMYALVENTCGTISWCHR